MTKRRVKKISMSRGSRDPFTTISRKERKAKVEAKCTGIAKELFAAFEKGTKGWETNQDKWKGGMKSVNNIAVRMMKENPQEAHLVTRAVGIMKSWLESSLTITSKIKESKEEALVWLLSWMRDKGFKAEEFQLLSCKKIESEKCWEVQGIKPYGLFLVFFNGEIVDNYEVFQKTEKGGEKDG